MRLFYTDTVMALKFTDRTPATSLIYRYKYRARNINGWGEFSEVGFLFAADIPHQSQTPERVSFDKS